MANVKVKDHDAAEKYLKATGAGSDVDPFVVEHEVVQGTAADLNVTEASGADIKTAVETVAGAVSGSEMQADIVASLPAGTNIIGYIGVVPLTSGGLSIHRSIDLDESEEEVKGSAGQLYGYFLYNLATAKRYIKFYDGTAAVIVVGTDTPVMTIPLEADQGANVNFGEGVQFSSGICIAATTGLADNDTGAPGANEVVANIFYK